MAVISELQVLDLSNVVMIRNFLDVYKMSFPCCLICIFNVFNYFFLP